MNTPEPVELVTPLTAGWEMASAEPGSVAPDALDGLSFVPTQVPGTVAGALRAAGLWREGVGMRFDEQEYWFRCQFDATPATQDEHVAMRFGGITTGDVWLNGTWLGSSTMFEAFEEDVTHLLKTKNELVIGCRPLDFKTFRRITPTARWRTRVVQEQQLRWHRTTLLGRAAGFAPEPEPVGPWREISLVRRRTTIASWNCQALLHSVSGTVRATCEFASSLPTSGTLQVGDHTAPFIFDGPRATTELTMAQVNRWWPHTHGAPYLYSVRAVFEMPDGRRIFHDAAPVGFRTVASATDSINDGLALHLNGIPVFCRGVVWTPIDVITLQHTPEQLRTRLTLLREGGFNMVRIVGTAWYEDELFHRLCDELGILVWQDMMFANMDYPFADEGFLARATAEVDTQCSRLSQHASTAVICGNSEIEQQAAMLGLAPDAGRSAFFGEQLPAIVEQHLPGIPYLPSAPCGGSLPFRTNHGVANYFGVGAYLRPLTDARLAEVRFASECLAFSNVPEPEAIDQMAAATPGGISPTHPVWKRGVPRDAGAGWDFEDVRDHYLKLLYNTDPAALRYASTERYFELSRLVTGELMAHVFGEWRRKASPCMGGIILWCNDLAPGAGWGIIDHTGRPKAAYWFLKRALAPVTVWMSDEGLNGVDVHVASDGAEPLNATLRVALYQHGERRVGEGSRTVSLAPYSVTKVGVEELLGHFTDASCAYRFGPPGHDLIVASLYAGAALLSQAFHFPAGHHTQREPIERLGITGSCQQLTDDQFWLKLAAARFCWGVRISAKGCTPADQYFGLEPGLPRTILLQTAGTPPTSISVTAVNAEGRVVIPVEAAP